MDINVKVRRFDPEAESPKPFWQEYPVTMDDSATVLDTLLAIREQDALLLPQRHLRLLRHAHQRPRRARLQDKDERRG